MPYKGWVMPEATKAKLREASLRAGCRPPSQKGKKYTPEHRARIAAALKGNTNNLGRRHSETAKRNMSTAQRKAWAEGRQPGFTGHAHSLKEKERRRLVLLGKPRPDLAGPLSPNWRGGVTDWRHDIRSSVDYKNWRRAVYERDDYTCQKCGKRKELEAHHLKPFALYPWLVFDVDNGQTLCRDCHKKTDTYLNRRMANWAAYETAIDSLEER